MTSVDTIFSLPMLSAVFFSIAVLIIARSIQGIVDAAICRRTKKEDTVSTQAALSVAGTIMKVVVWIIALVLLLANLGVDVTSLIAGLGIGGIAVALASQNILSDLLSAFAIYFDKPFQVGDYIATGSAQGIVKEIGMRTTRLRGADGEEIILANKDLVAAQVRNYSRRYGMQAILTCEVLGRCSNDMFARICGLAQSSVTQKGISFQSAYLIAWKENSLHAEIHYSSTSKDEERVRDMLARTLVEFKKGCADKKISCALSIASVRIVPL